MLSPIHELSENSRVAAVSERQPVFRLISNHLQLQGRSRIVRLQRKVWLLDVNNNLLHCRRPGHVGERQVLAGFRPLNREIAE